MENKKNEQIKISKVNISIERVDDLFKANAKIFWSSGSTVNLETDATFESISEAIQGVDACLNEALPTIQKEIEDSISGKVPNEKTRSFAVSKKDNIQSFNFSGEVAQLTCKCHKGQWAVYAYAIDSKTKTKNLIGSVFVADEDSGSQIMEDFVYGAASAFLEKTHGINTKDAISKTVLKGKEAEAKELMELAPVDKTIH